MKGITAFFLLCAVLASMEMTPLSHCLSIRGVPFLRKDSADWSEQSLPWNIRLQYTPLEIVVARSVRQIQQAVICASKHNVRVSAKSGGHSFGSFGYGGENGHLVIALNHMTNVTLTPDNVAYVEPGATLGHIALELYSQGERAIPHGECPSVGISGHVLHGGIGLISKKYGLTLDWLNAATMVLWNGTTVHCSASQNDDLFWAIRGAGSSFGIVVNLEFNTFAAPHRVTPFSIDQQWNEAEAKAAINTIQKFALNSSQDISLDLFMRSTGQSIEGMFYGSYEDMLPAITPLLQKLKTKLSFAATMGWIEGLEHLADGQPLDQTPGYIKHDLYYATSAMTDALSPNQIESLVGTMFRNIHNESDIHGWSYVLELHGGPNSAITAFNSSATAFPHRHRPLLHQFSTIALPNSTYDAGFTLLKSLRECITESIEPGSWGMYANYVDTEIDGPTARALYWAKNLDRLQKLKSLLDPYNMFWNPQSVIA